jgi:peptidoglycan/xylan/chitin deacetylase (PgdA/CDA1 family)
MLNQVEQTRGGGVDVIGCAGMLFLVLLALALVRAFFGGTERPASVAAEPAARVSAASATRADDMTVMGDVTEAATAAALATLTPSATANATATVRPSATRPPTITPLPTSTATAPPTGTPVPTPTSTPLPTATAQPTLTAVSEDIEDDSTPALLPALMPTPLGESVTVQVPILMYHYISVPPAGADKYRVDLSVEPDVFRRQMAYLRDNGYTTIDLYDLSLAIANQVTLPPKPVIITLDDGYRDNYENAFPILQEFGFEATFFIVTELVDRGIERYMTWAMIEEMARAGMRMEVHSRTHLDLRGRTREELIWQMLGPQQTLAAHIGYTPRYFSYPSGRYDAATLAMVEELDFWGAVTTVRGTAHGFEDRYTWSRQRVSHGLPLHEFAKHLR